MKRILLMTTGGTIASASTARGLLPTMNGETLLSYLPNMQDVCLLDTVEVCNIDSTDMTAAYWKKIVDSIRTEYDRYDGFVISHGTDTLAYTAAALTYMVQNSNKPIILTGSQKPISFDSTDAKVNLTDSILCAIDEHSRGVQVVFDGKIIAGSRAKKTMSVSYHAFSSINYPYLGIIQNGKIIRYIETSSYKEPLRFYDFMSDSVFLLKLTPCTTPEMVSVVFDHYNCVIMESFGSGGIPDRLVDSIVKAKNKYGNDDKILIITTQVVYEGSHVAVYEVGNRLKGKVQFLEAHDMNIETTLAKAMWICGLGKVTFAEAETLFYKRVEVDMVG